LKSDRKLLLLWKEVAMNVAAILEQKGRGVTTAKPGASLLEVVNRLSAKRIGAIVIVEPSGEIAGILSERDVVRALSAHGLDCLHQPVSESMAPVVTCQEADTLDALMAMMTARRSRHLPVVTDNELVGIISIGDVVKHHVADVKMEAVAMREYIAQT
jgi:CBS domain-containing protein